MYLQSAFIDRKGKLIVVPYYDDGYVSITLYDVKLAMAEISGLEILGAEIKRQYTYNPSRRKYYYEGKLISRSSLYGTKAFITEKANVIIRDVPRGKDWLSETKEVLKREHIRQYMLGRGGIEQMTSRDWGIVGAALRDQYNYLQNFELAAETYSDAQFNNILGMYVDAATASFNKGMGAAFSLHLPAFPGDGTTRCHVRCACEWELIPDEKGFISAYWRLGPVKTEHCEDCYQRSIEWNPLVL